MQTRRLLFVQSTRGAGLVPIYLAIIALLLAGVLGLLVASWPGAREANHPRDGHRDKPVPAEPSTGGLTAPAERPPSGQRLRSL